MPEDLLLFLTSSWPKNTNFYRKTVVCFDAKGYGNPGRVSFYPCRVSFGFTLSLPCSAPWGTEQTTIDTGCDPALPRDCVDHPADCNLFKKYLSLRWTTNPIHHLIFGGGIVRGCTVLCVIDMYGHRWDTDKRSCFLCSEQHVHAVGDDAHLQFYPALLARREYQQYKCFVLLVAMA